MANFYQRAALRARWSGGAICSPPGEKFPVVVDRGHKDLFKKVIEVTKFNSLVKCDLRGCLEAAMASEATREGCYRQHEYQLRGNLGF